jgi:hypothetical protein
LQFIISLDHRRPEGRFLMLVPFLKMGTMVCARAIQLVIPFAGNSIFHRPPSNRFIVMATLIADFGTNAWTVLDSSTQTTTSMSPEDFHSLQWASAGDTLIAENAHLGCIRTYNSLAQVYTKEE